MKNINEYKEKYSKFYFNMLLKNNTVESAKEYLSIGGVFENLSHELKENVSVVYDALSLKKVDYKDLSIELKTHVLLAVHAISIDAKNIEHMADSLKNNFDIMSNIVKKDNTLFQYASTELKNNKELLYVAIVDNNRFKENATEVIAMASSNLQKKCKDLNEFFSEMKEHNHQKRLDSEKNMFGRLLTELSKDAKEGSLWNKIDSIRNPNKNKTKGVKYGN